MTSSGAESVSKRIGVRTGVRKSLLLALAAAMTALVGLAVVPAANAMITLENGTGYPGDQVQVRVQNQQSGPRATWRITAPPNTTITSAIGANPSGFERFNCVVQNGGASAACDTAPGVVWGAGNVVTLQLDIAPTAPAGTYTGTSSLPWESAPYTVTVLPPSAPTLQAPADGTASTETQPPISGTKVAGHSVQALVDGVVACAVPADDSTTWQCTPTAPLSPGTHQISATQTSPGGSTGPASGVHTYEVTQLSNLTLTIADATGRAGESTTISGLLRNNGPGAATNPRLRVNFADLTVSNCRVSGQAVPCADLQNGTTIADLANGAIARLEATIAIPQGAANGQRYPVRGVATAENQSEGPATARAVVRAIAIVTPPPPDPDPDPDPDPPRPPRPPVRIPDVTPLVPRPAPQPAPVPVAEPDEPEETEDEPEPAAPEPTLPRASTPLPINFSTGLKGLQPGTARTFSGTFGPISGSEAAEVVISGRLGRGLLVRLAELRPVGDCEVVAREFSCTVLLKPGDIATLDLRVFADPKLKSQAANLQLAVDADPDQFDNVKTASIPLASQGQSAGAFGDAGSLLGLPVVLLAMFLFALAAHTERGRTVNPSTTRPTND